MCRAGSTRKKMVRERERQGRGEAFPLPAGSLPQWREPPWSSAWGNTGGEPDTGLPLPAVQEMTSNVAPGHGCSPDIASTATARGGRGRSAAGAGGVGVLARSKMVGVWETGEGEQVPPPRQPHPPWRYPHGPQHGEILEKSRIRFPAGSTPDTAAHQVSQARTPPREWGCRQRSMGGLPAEG